MPIEPRTVTEERLRKVLEKRREGDNQSHQIVYTLRYELENLLGTIDDLRAVIDGSKAPSDIETLDKTSSGDRLPVSSQPDDGA